MTQDLVLTLTGSLNGKTATLYTRTLVPPTLVQDAANIYDELTGKDLAISASADISGSNVIVSVTIAGFPFGSLTVPIPPEIGTLLTIIESLEGTKPTLSASADFVVPVAAPTP